MNRGGKEKVKKGGKEKVNRGGKEKVNRDLTMHVAEKESKCSG